MSQFRRVDWENVAVWIAVLATSVACLGLGLYLVARVLS
jgi:hypothetical protein